MKHSLTLLFVALLSITLQAQVFTSSNLPIVIITTDNDPFTGQPAVIPDDPKIGASMKIIYHSDGSRNYMSEQNTSAVLNYVGRIGIEVRGSSSQWLDKKAYSLTTRDPANNNQSVSILNMPSESDWILNSLPFDPALIRDYLSYDLSRSIGQYAARGQYCEVVLNGDYVGLYIFMEKIKVDNDRVNVEKMATTDNTGEALSGGYLTKADRPLGNDIVAWTMQSYANATPTVSFLHESPKQDEITTQQDNYIYNKFTDLATTAGNQNASITTGYPSLIDIPSFVDFMIMNELASNVDAYQLSTFFHKDRGGKLRAGPVWDFNLTYGNDLFAWGYDRSRTNVWQFNNSDNNGPMFWKDLYDDTTFKCYLSKRWTDLTAANQPLNYNVISSRIDDIVSPITEAAARDDVRWSSVGSLGNNIADLKTWLNTRINWLDTRLSSFQACANPSLPALVISQIHYNPANTGNLLSDDLEFIEITNNSAVDVDMTGYYFSIPGFCYQFPANSTLNANTSLFLTSNTAVFTQFHGFAPFGEYTRQLSNKSQNLVLSDAYGNIIDEVEYQDSAPWPVAADGTGPYLQLIDLNYDNSLAASWEARTILGTSSSALAAGISLYPNPSHDVFNVNSQQQAIKAYMLYDLIGRPLLSEQQVYTNTLTLDLNTLAPSTYLIKLVFEDNTYTLETLIKQ